MNNEIAMQGIYEKIYSELNLVPQRPFHLGFFSVDVVLFNYLYHKKKGNLDAYTDFEQHIEMLVKQSMETSRKFFCAGKAAIDWFLSFLHKEGVIDNEDWEFLRSGDSEQAEFSMEELRKGNYDLLHGAVGIAYYLLYERGIEYESYFREFIQELVNLCDASEFGMITSFDFVNAEKVPNEVNLGLSHGIPSILKFCIACLRKDICSIEAEKLAKRIIKYLMEHVREKDQLWRFQFSVVDNKITNNPGMLAWCYGDLGITYVLYQAGIAFDDKRIVDFSIEILKKTATMITQAENHVHDAGICHGASGAAYIYHKLWMMSQETDFKMASDRWLEQTLAMAYSVNKEFIYMQFDNRTGQFQENYTLLQGTSGIGLVLHSLLTNESDWDYYLMLN